MDIKPPVNLTQKPLNPDHDEKSKARTLLPTDDVSPGASPDINPGAPGGPGTKPYRV